MACSSRDRSRAATQVAPAGVAALHEQHGRIVDAAVCARERDQRVGAARERQLRDEDTAPLGIVDVLVDAVAAKRKDIAALDADRHRVGAGGRTVADHPRRIAGRPALRRHLAEMREGVVARQQLDACIVARRPAIRAAVADPADEPPGGEDVERRCERDGRGARPIGDARDRRGDRPVGTEHGGGDAVAVDRLRFERLVQRDDEQVARCVRHRAAADAIGDDEEAGAAFERAVRVLVDRMLAAARRRDGRFETAERVRIHRLARFACRHRSASALARATRLDRRDQPGGRER